MIPLLYTFIIERTDSMNMNMNMDNGNEHKNAHLPYYSPKASLIRST